MGESPAAHGQTPEEISTAVEEHAEALREALAAHGITLPSLGVEPLTYGGGYPFPLVALGNCNLDTARRLTDVLRTSAPTVPVGTDR